jgi:protein-disulfide isomerase
MSSLRLVPVVLALSAVLPGCTHSGGGTASSSAPAAAESASPGPRLPASVSPGDVVAEVNGAPILGSELEAKAAPNLTRVRQQEYEIRRQALDELIADRLLDVEAAKRGLSRTELLRREVDEKVQLPPSDQIDSIYEHNKDRFSGMTATEAKARIREVLGDRARSERRAAFEQQLRQAATVTTRLDAPRAGLTLPAGAPATGPANAKVTIVEFTDYQCPYCHRAQGVIDEILSRYRNEVRLVHLDFPLDGHPGAMPAARAARCAAEQGKFWEYHHGLMTVPGPLDRTDLERRAASLHLDASDFSSCLASGRYDAAIQASLEQGEALGVTGTPAYFINGRMVSGARPLADFTRIIDDELAGS